MSKSPDRLNKSPDKSLDKHSYVSGDYTDISRKSTLSNISELENEIWKNIQNNLNNEIIDNKVNTNEKTEFIGRIKDFKIVLGKYLQFFILDSKDDLDKFLNKLNQKPEKEIGFIFENNDFEKANNIKQKKNIKHEKDEEKIKKRKIDINDIKINNINLEKKKVEENNIEESKIKSNEKFSGVFEEEKDEKIELKYKNNWMDLKDKECDINTISEFEEKRRKSSNELNCKYNKKFQFQTSSDKIKEKKEDLKEEKISEFNLDDKKIDQKEKVDEDNQPERIKSGVVKRKKKISITFE